MEVKLRGSLEARMLENLGTIFRRITDIHLETPQNKIPVDMFTASYLPYEASRTYRAIIAEFECNRARVRAEAQRQNFRGM